MPCLGNSRFDCKSKPDGYYADPNNIHNFHGCDHNCATDFTCPPYTYWDNDRHVCAYENNPAPNQPTPAPPTQSPPQTPPPPTPVVDLTTERSNNQSNHDDNQTTASSSSLPVTQFVTPAHIEESTRGRHSSTDSGF